MKYKRELEELERRIEKIMEDVQRMKLLWAVPDKAQELADYIGRQNEV